MDNIQRKARIRQLDRQLLALRGLAPNTPTGGWIRSVREALGLSLASFGRRLGVAQSTAHQIEQAEANETITVKRLRAAADALGCDLSITLIPRQSLAEIIEQRALELANERIHRVRHTMFLEAQGVSEEALREAVESMAREIIEKGDARLWE